MGIGEKIRQARQKAGLSQGRLAEIIQVKRATIAAWEIGRNEPSAETIRNIATACRVSADWLLEMPVDYSDMPDDARLLAEKINTLPPGDRAVIEKVLTAMAEQNEEKKPIPTSRNG